MVNGPLLISTGKLKNDCLKDKVAIVTGGGNGIGFEAARALVWLGSNVVIAEIDKIGGRSAALKINEEAGSEKAIFFHTDIGDEGGIEHLKFETQRRLGKVDIVLNNATVAPLGAIKDKLVRDWDRSYRVNLRGPAMLARAFLPEMLERNSGVFVGVSSFGGAYMGAYESLKRAQVVLVDTLAEELEGTEVIAFTIGPGQARTSTLEESVKEIAPLYGKTPEEFIEMNKEALISVEAAGAGFAASIALAPTFRGLETTSLQALLTAGIKIDHNSPESKRSTLSFEQMDRALKLCREVRKTLAEQSDDWKKRPLFERKWVINDFNRNTGIPVEKWLAQLDKLCQCLESHGPVTADILEIPLEKIASYWKHQADLARGYTKNPDELKKQLEILGEWEKTTEKLAELICRNSKAN
jgi:NAD(P)-dependent dehydrogenase (short-subunit alcohol dehydrogenase family)